MDFKTIKAVIFDLDGVLIDSETYYLQRHYRFADYYGYPITHEMFNKFIGSNPKLDMFKWAYEQANISCDYETYRHNKEVYYNEIEPFNYWNNKEIAFPWSYEIIHYLYDNGYKLAVASSSPKDYIEYYLKQMNCRECISIIQSGRDFKESKPNPAIYLKTIELLELQPSQCIVVEDSPFGMQAGKSAGCYVIGRKDTRYPVDMSLANTIVEDLRELKYIL